MLQKRGASGDVVVFLAIFLPLTAFAEWLLIDFGAARRPAVGFIMWTVGLSALATALVRRIPFDRFGWQWGAWRYHGIAVALPLAYCLVTYVGADLLALTAFAEPDRITAFNADLGFEELPFALGFVAAVFLAIVGGASGAMVRALGEEIGWRGFLTPRVNIMSGFVLGTLLTGLAWSSWHLPALFAGDYSGGGPRITEATCFVVMVVATSGTYAWLRMASDSLWPAVTLHAAHNLLVQSVFDPLVTPTGEITMTGEFGVALAAVIVVFSLPFWILGQRLWTASRP